MFGVIAAGKLVQTNFEQVEEGKFIITIQDAKDVNHIVIFLTGAQAFPSDLGGSVYFSVSGDNGQQLWHCLGHISNEKPSAIFKISKIKANSSSAAMVFGPKSEESQIGISVEPLSIIKEQTPASGTVPQSNTFEEFSRFVGENLYNYAASFAHTPQQIIPNPNELYLPISILTQWYDNFRRRLQSNPNFWKK